jgi:hypothetical protein
MFSDTVSGIDPTSSSYKIGYSATGLTSTPAASDFGTTLAVVGSGTGFATGSTISLAGTNPAAGYYYLLVAVTNNAGKMSSAVSGPYQYNAAPPALSSLTAQLTTDGTGISLSWQAPDSTDDVSGISYYTLYYLVSGSTNRINVTTSGTKAFVDLAGLYGDTLTFYLTATDNANNTSTPPVTAVVTVPPQLSLSVQNDVAASDGQTMVVEVDLGISASQYQQYQSVSVSRTISLHDGTTVPTTIVLPAYDQSSGSWTLDGQNNLVYLDGIPVSSGGGNHWCYYSVSSTSPTIPQSSASPGVTLPSHAPRVTYMVEDLGGNLLQANSGVTTESLASNVVQVVANVSDPDEDDVSVWAVNQLGAFNPTGMTMSRQLGSSVTFTYSDTLGSYQGSAVKVSLMAGEDTQLAVAWERGSTTGELPAVYDFVLGFVNGSYSLTIGTVLATDPNHQLVIRPGEPLNLSITGGTSSDAFMWNWGDGSTSGPTASHTYSQQPTQNGPSYTTSVIVKDKAYGVVSTLFSIPIEVLDTQSGTLLTDETWNGNHTVTGTVEVPNNMTLTINGNNNGETVTFDETLGTPSSEGLLVDSGGTLVIKATGGSVVLKNLAGTGVTWGTIEVQGRAAIGGATIQGADRGITVGGSGNVTLAGTKLQNNGTGLHVVGNGASASVQPGVNVSAAMISGNTVYGIKEDAGARPLLTNTTILGNFRDYYSWNGGLLHIGDINALPGNSGNLGE